MENVSIFVKLIFVLTTFFTVWQFYNASNKRQSILIILGIYLLIQAALGISGFYQNTGTVPPRFTLLLAPGLIVILLLFFTNKGKQFIDQLNIKKLTLLHITRVPVEIVLFYIYSAGLIPALMTFEGYNFDILSGLSAGIIYYLVFVSKQVGNRVLLIWNMATLILLINIVTIAILSAPTTFQKLAFNHPNVGILYFPFVWLPAVIVPTVLLSHLVSIRQILREAKK